MENQRIQIVPYKQYGVEQECLDIGVKDTIDGKNERTYYCTTRDKYTNSRRPDWSKIHELTYWWERSTRANLQPLVERYQAGDHSVLEEIENSLEALAYHTADNFAFDADPDTSVFVNEAGVFDKRIPKAPDTEDPEDDVPVMRKMYVQLVPFKFDDDDIEDQFVKTVKAALNKYNPDKGTLFSTWFVRRFKYDLRSLYKEYKDGKHKLMNQEEYDRKGLRWSKTIVSIPEKTAIPVTELTLLEAAWISLVLESQPYELSVQLRSEMLGISEDTDKNIRKRLKKKLTHKGEMKQQKIHEHRPYSDPTFDAVNKLMTTGESLEETKLIPSPAYRWYKDKNGLKVIRGSTGECKLDWPDDIVNWLADLRRMVKQGREIPIVKLKKPRRKFYVYNHTRKVYCKNLLTRSELLGYLAIRDAVIGAGYLKSDKVYKISKFSGFFRIT